MRWLLVLLLVAGAAYVLWPSPEPEGPASEAPAPIVDLPASSPVVRFAEKKQPAFVAEPRPQNWGERFAPAYFREAVDHAIERSGLPYELRAYDCSDYPCVAWFEFDRAKNPAPLSFADYFPDEYDDDLLMVGGCNDVENGKSYVHVAIRPRGVPYHYGFRPSLKDTFCPE